MIKVQEIIRPTAITAAPQLPPEFGRKVPTTFLKDLARVRGEVKRLLDVDHVRSGEQLDASIDFAA